MALSNNVDAYGTVSKLLHWGIAGLIIALLALGWLMGDLNFYDPWYHDALSWHKSFGIIVALIVACKLVWTIYTPTPPLQASLTAIERSAALMVHYALLAAMIVVPISGYLISTSQGAVVEVFDWFNFPALVMLDDAARDSAITVHYYFSYLTLALVIVHSAAAIKHQLIDGKGTLKRLL